MPVTEYNKWDSQPRILTDEEIADPMIVIDEVFDYAHLPDLRNILWEWLKTTVTGNFNKKSHYYRDRESLMEFYERMQKLLEAAHLLLVANKLATINIKPRDLTKVTISDTEERKVPPATELLPIIEKLVTLLTPELVFEVGMVKENNSNSPVYYFLIVLPDTTVRTYAECQVLVETACSDTGTVQLLTIKAGDLKKYLLDGHLLYTRLCKEQYLIYAREGLGLPPANHNGIPDLVKTASEGLEIVLGKAQAFYDGAGYYLTLNNYPLAVFMLQQAAEHALRGFLHAVTGRNHVGHDILALRRYALPFYNKLTDILPVWPDKETCLLHHLGKAYVQARYQNDFMMTVAEISLLKDWIEKLLNETTTVFEQRMVEVLQVL